MAEPSVEELRAVLVAVKPESEFAVDQVVYKVRIHVIEMRREALDLVPRRLNSPFASLTYRFYHLPDERLRACDESSEVLIDREFT